MRPSAKCGISDFRPVAIRNPLSADFAVLRTDLYAPLLEIAGHNLNNESKMVKIFEIGHIFRKLEDDSILERKLVAGLMTGIEENVFWNSVEKDVDFYYFKGAVENFITSLALNDVALISHPVDNQSAFEYGQIVCVEEESIGEFGKLRSEVAERFDIKTPVFLFAFDYPLLLQKYRPVTKYQLFSRFPTVNRDLSIIVEEAVSAIDIETVLRAHGGDFLLKLEFFDLYRGKQLPEGKKSLSVSLRFGSTERTLTDTEVDVNVNNIISAIIAKGWKLRE
jgi:phenylalanyl-tRNA synthetase beta chain